MQRNHIGVMNGMQRLHLVHLPRLQLQQVLYVNQILVNNNHHHRHEVLIVIISVVVVVVVVVVVGVVLDVEAANSIDVEAREALIIVVQGEAPHHTMTTTIFITILLGVVVVVVVVVHCRYRIVITYEMPGRGDAEAMEGAISAGTEGTTGKEGAVFVEVGGGGCHILMIEIFPHPMVG